MIAILKITQPQYSHIELGLPVATHWFSPLLREVFLLVFRFSPFVKKQNFQIVTKVFKTESIEKLSNFNSQWTKPLYQNNLRLLHSSLHFSRPKEVINYL